MSLSASPSPAPTAPAPTGDPTSAPTPEPTAPVQPTSAPADPTSAPTPESESTKVDISTLPEAVQKEIRDARAEAAKYRTDLKAQSDAAAALQDQIAAINKALGITSDEPDPKALETTLAEREAELKALKVENAFTTSAVKIGADAELTLAVLARNGTLAKLDPSSQTFVSELDAAIKAAVEANPKLRAGQVPAASGSQGFTGDGSSRSTAPVDLRQAIAKAMS